MGGGEGGSSEPHELPLDSPLVGLGSVIVAFPGYTSFLI